MSVADALAAVHAGRPEEAAERAARAGTALGDALARYLHRTISGSVYDDPAAFAAFIRGGGNVGLYRAASAELAAQYDVYGVRRLLDLGCGDGLALLPALRSARRLPATVTVVEPSAALLARTTAQLAELALAVDSRPVGGQQFADTLADGEAWDLMETTFAIHTIPPAERDEVLALLRPHVDHLTIVEFDVPDLAPGSPEHLERLADIYERGLAEYGPDADLVGAGFLLPVLVGQLAPDAPRMTYEQPAAAWQAQVERAGFAGTSVQPLYDYWSAPAFVLTAHPA